MRSDHHSDRRDWVAIVKNSFNSYLSSDHWDLVAASQTFITSLAIHSSFTLPPIICLTSSSVIHWCTSSGLDLWDLNWHAVWLSNLWTDFLERRDDNAIYTSLKSTFSGLQFRRWQYQTIFIRLAVIGILPPKTREMLRNSKRIWRYSSSRSSRSSILVSMESPYVTSYYSLIVTLAVSATVFEIFTLKDRKLLILPTPSFFDALDRGEPLRISGLILPRKM